MKALNMLARWIVMSSADPSEVSLTIKGVLVGVIPYAMIAFGLTHINIGQDQLSALVDAVASLVQAALSLIAVVMTTAGMIRKLWNTIKAHQAATTPGTPVQG